MQKKRFEKSLVLQFNAMWQLNMLAWSLLASMMQFTCGICFNLLRLAGEQMQSGAAKVARGGGQGIALLLESPYHG